MLESMQMRGALTLQLVERDGRVAHTQIRRNRIVKSGRLLVAQLFGGVSSGTPPTPVSHVAVGIDGTAPTDDDAALGSQRATPNAITAVTYLPFDDPVAGGGVVKRTRASVTAVFDFDEANGPEPLREAGLLTAASGGVLYNRVVFDPVTKTNAFKLTVLWDVVF